MLVKALCDYYDILEPTGIMLPKYFSNVSIDYIISLSEEGAINDIIDCREDEEYVDKGKTKTRKIGRNMIMPERGEVSAIRSDFIEHRAEYIFGFVLNSKTVKYNEQKHKEFVSRNTEYIKGIDAPVVNAFRKFLETWDPKKGSENPFLSGLKNFSTLKFAFCLNRNTNELLHDNPLILERWGEIPKDENLPQRQCAITGKRLPMAVKHRKIKGIANGETSGCLLVTSNNDAEKSYGAVDSSYSGISQQAMKKYTEVLNYLLQTGKNKSVVEGMTIVYWTPLANPDNVLNSAFSASFISGDTETKDDVEMFLRVIMENAQKGTLDHIKLEESADIHSDFYVVGLKPSKTRLSVKFIYKNEFGKMMYNIAQHQEDIKIHENGKLIHLWQIRKELIRESKNELLDTTFVSRLFDAIINNRPYPDNLLHVTLNRIRYGSEIDKPQRGKHGEKKQNHNSITPLKVGLIKGYLNRKARFNNKKEEFTLSLNKDNTDPAYLCGRLFSIMENAQMKAAAETGGLNKTIKDKFFSAAMSRPGSVFPTLKKLNEHHLSKLQNAQFIEKDMGEIMDKLENNFPLRLTPAEQGAFVIGYYQETTQRIRDSKEHKKTQEEK